MAIDNAAKHGCLENIRYLADRGLKCTASALADSAEKGYLEVVKFLVESKLVEEWLKWPTRPMDEAATRGHFSVVEYLHSVGAVCSREAMNGAAENGHLNIVRFLHENRTEGSSQGIMDRAADKGHTEIVKFLHFNRSTECTRFTLRMSLNTISDGSLLKFLLDECVSKDPQNSIYQDSDDIIMMSALKNHGNPEYPAVRMLLARYPPCRRNLYYAMLHVVSTNNIEIAEILYEAFHAVPITRALDLPHLTKVVKRPMLDWINKRIPVSTVSAQISYYAMVNADLAIVKYLVDERNYPVSLSMLERCIFLKDGLEIIKYIAAKCVEPLTEKIIVNAAQHNRLDIIEYLMDNYRPTIKYTFHAPDAAAMYGNTDVFIYLMEKDKTVRYKLALNYAKTFHHHDILYYIRHKKRPIKQL